MCIGKLHYFTLLCSLRSACQHVETACNMTWPRLYEAQQTDKRMFHSNRKLIGYSGRINSSGKETNSYDARALHSIRTHREHVTNEAHLFEIEPLDLNRFRSLSISSDAIPFISALLDCFSQAKQQKHQHNIIKRDTS